MVDSWATMEPIVIARITPSPASRPIRNGFWIFTRGSTLGADLLSVLEHASKALEVRRHLGALLLDLGEPLLGVRDEEARALLGLGHDRGRAVLRLLDHRRGGLRGLLALDA